MKKNITLDQMTPAQERAFFRKFERTDGTAAKEHLAAGRPIVYRESDTPAGHVIKEYPDGRRELIRSEKGREIIERDLPATK